MSTFPSSWVACTLGDVIEYGRTKKAEPNEIPQDAWVLELEDIEKDTSRLLHHATFAERLSKSTKNRFAQGDILYGKLRPYLNKVVRAAQDGFCTTEIVPLSPPLGLDGRYLFYWLKHPRFTEYVNSVSHGLNMPRLGTESGRSAPFILAPYKEQVRIADKLDDLLSRANACRDRLDRASILLRQLRRAILLAAFRGQLTSDFRFSSVDESDSIAESVDLPPGWYWATIGDLFRVEVGATPSRKEPNYWGGGIPWVSSGEVAFCRISTTKETITDFGLVSTSTKLHPPGTVLIGMIGEGKTRGQVAILDIAACNNQNSAAIRVSETEIPPEYVYRYLEGQYEATRIAGSGNNQQALNKARVQAIRIPIAPPNEQKRIVSLIEQELLTLEGLEAACQRAYNHLSLLEKSILTKAFRGELVPQDPNDEPASVLLERIRAARVECGATKPKRSRKPQSMAEA